MWRGLGLRITARSLGLVRVVPVARTEAGTEIKKRKRRFHIVSYISCRNRDRRCLDSQKLRFKIEIEVNRMLLGRIVKAIFVLLLAVGLGIGPGIGNAQPPVTTAQAGLLWGATHSDCDHCDGCDRPCVVQAVCGHPCIPLGLLAGNAPPTIHVAKRPIAEPDWHVSSVFLRTPTPPPRS